MSARRLAQLKAALKYSSGADRTAIRALILEIECGFSEPDAARSSRVGADVVPTDDRHDEPGRSQPATADRGQEGDGRLQQDPERAEVVDPERKPSEAGDAEDAVDLAGGSSETDARQSGGCGSAVPQRPVEAPTGKPVSHGGAGGSPAPEGADPDRRVCETCGHPYRRKPSVARAEFAKRRFCRKACIRVGTIGQARRRRHARSDTPRLDGAGDWRVYFADAPTRTAQSLSEAKARAGIGGRPYAEIANLDTGQHLMRFGGRWIETRPAGSALVSLA